jgi:hypothetical protein
MRRPDLHLPRELLFTELGANPPSQMFLSVFLLEPEAAALTINTRDDA